MEGLPWWHGRLFHLWFCRLATFNELAIGFVGGWRGWEDFTSIPIIKLFTYIRRTETNITYDYYDILLFISPKSS